VQYGMWRSFLVLSRVPPFLFRFVSPSAAMFCAGFCAAPIARSMSLSVTLGKLAAHYRADLLFTKYLHQTAVTANDP